MESQKDDAQQRGPLTGARINMLATLVAGLVIGMLAGYFGRPLVTPRPMDPTPVRAGETVTPSNGSAAVATLMEAVVAQTRHFKGDPDAPITIIEFSDFQ
jgi:hypothetical protein